MQPFPEYEELERIIANSLSHARVKVCATVQSKNKTFHQYGIVMGSQDPKAPVFGIFGGVHGLERIGSRVALAFLNTAAELSKWDSIFKHFLENNRILFMPLVNPVGTFNKERANGNGVDLMRNAPVDSNESSFLAGGHRISKWLPWYRGPQNGPMEPESQGLVDFVKENSFQSSSVITLDVHSGYGTVDRLWFPYAKSKSPFPDVGNVHALKEYLDKTFPNHIYHVEPQSAQYTTHGDLWDYLYDLYQKENPGKTYLPLSLEMGSWIWVKKNPRQFFSVLGIFNPVMNHRLRRTLRRHLALFDFLTRAVATPKIWAQLPNESKKIQRLNALKLWYPKDAEKEVA